MTEGNARGIDDSSTKNTQGSGIGLALTKELVELHHGAISAESEQGQGTTFTIQLPLGKDHLKPEEIIETPVTNSQITNPQLTTPPITNEPLTTPQLTTPPITSNDTIILIVEDNPDMRAYISDQLKEEFKILQAVDGEEGIRLALENIPDLIISDVMMPKKNGYQLCEALKTDERTSHIPIILLTAKAAPEDKLTGYETGADDYIFKPFHADELTVRTRNLIYMRRKLQQRFSLTPQLKPSEMNISSVDQTFLDKVIDIVKDHLSQADFGVEEMGRKIGMSSPTLRRKFRGLLNQSPNDFIRTIRLQHGRQMLEATAGNIAEIAFAVGFETPSYFTKCFKEQFGFSPSELKKGK